MESHVRDCLACEGVKYKYKDAKCWDKCLRVVYFVFSLEWKQILKILPALSPTFSGPNMLLNSLSGEKKLKSSALPLSRGLEHKY